MDERIGNFQSDIHDSGYEREFLKKRLDARTLFCVDGRRSESLSGEWNFAADWYDSCRRAKWYLERRTDGAGRPLPVDWDWEAWGPMKVPSSWNLERPELRYFEGSGVYARTFRYLPERPGERAFLRFEGAQYRTSVFLNGEHLGTHDGGSTPFCAEITGFAREDNRLIVVVEARRRPDRVPPENTDWFNYGGLYRDVLLFRTPPRFIKDWFLRLAPGSACSRLVLDARIDAGSGPAEGTARLRIPGLGVDFEAPVLGGRASATIGARPELWSPESPKLYEVELSFAPEGENAEDFVRDRIGFREIRVAGGEILLNGESVFLRGVSVHEDHVEKGKTADEQTIRATIAHLKELHGNYLRLAHYPHDARFARIADEEGVLLWEELPVYWAVDFANPMTYVDAANQLAELVLRDRNRASVAVWSVGNENPDTDERLLFMSRLVEKARELDGTRPVSAACLVNHERLAIADRLAETLDIVGVNEYYGWYEPDFSKLARMLENSRPTKPVVICEFGGGARLGHRGAPDELFTEDRQARLYEEQVAVIGSCPYVKGMSPWILYDFRCPRRLNRHQEGFNRKGLIDADRSSKKLAFAVLSEFYAHLAEGRP